MSARPCWPCCRDSGWSRTWAAGPGRIGAELAPYVARVIGVDNSADMLRAARRRVGEFANVELRRGDLEALPRGRCHLRRGPADAGLDLCASSPRRRWQRPRVSSSSGAAWYWWTCFRTTARIFGRKMGSSSRFCPGAMKRCWPPRDLSRSSCRLPSARAGGKGPGAVSALASGRASAVTVLSDIQKSHGS